MILETKSLEIGYRKPLVNVANDINLKVEKATLTGIIGINGSGKSTMIKTLSANLSVLNGEIRLKNKSLNHYLPKELARLMSLVLTKQPLPQHLKVIDFVALGRQPYNNWIGINTHKDKSQIIKALKQVEMYHMKDNTCINLSDGQLQKVMIARAIAQDTPLIILDEPTSHLDMYHKALVLKLLKKITEEDKKSIVFATHEINLALQLCDSIILIKDRKVVQDSPDTLIEKGILHSLFPDDSIIFDEHSRQFIMKTGQKKK